MSCQDEGKNYEIEDMQLNIGNVSKGSNPAIYTFCTLILNCLPLAGDIGVLSQKNLYSLCFNGYRQRATLPTPNN